MAGTNLTFKIIHDISLSGFDTSKIEENQMYLALKNVYTNFLFIEMAGRVFSSANEYIMNKYLKCNSFRFGKSLIFVSPSV